VPANQVRQGTLDGQDQVHVAAGTRQHQKRFHDQSQTQGDFLTIPRHIARVDHDLLTAKLSQGRCRRHNRADRRVAVVGIRIGQVEQPAKGGVNRHRPHGVRLQPFPEGTHFVLPPRVEVLGRRAHLHRLDPRFSQCVQNLDHGPIDTAAG
jgi:hypothetical protein